MPVRVALTGSTVSPGLYESLELVGRDESLRRIDAAARRARRLIGAGGFAGFGRRGGQGVLRACTGHCTSRSRSRAYRLRASSCGAASRRASRRRSAWAHGRSAQPIATAVRSTRPRRCDGASQAAQAASTRGIATAGYAPPIAPAGPPPDPTRSGGLQAVGRGGFRPAGRQRPPGGGRVARMGVYLLQDLAQWAGATAVLAGMGCLIAALLGVQMSASMHAPRRGRVRASRGRWRSWAARPSSWPARPARSTTG